MSSIQVVILAAGKGKRMGASVPKPLVVIDGKPMISHLLATVGYVFSHPKPIAVISPYTQELFHEALGDAARFAYQDEPLGTGDAVKASKGLWDDADGILVLYADHPFLPKEALEQLRSAFFEHPEDIHLLTARVENFSGDAKVFSSWGRILRNSMGDVVGIREVKDASEEERKITEVNPSLFLFPATWLSKALDALTHNNASGEYYLTDVIAQAFRDGIALRAQSIPAFQVLGVNTPEDLLLAEKYHR